MLRSRVDAVENQGAPVDKNGVKMLILFLG
jgi:hypothetical protein